MVSLCFFPIIIAAFGEFCNRYSGFRGGKIAYPLLTRAEKLRALPRRPLFLLTFMKKRRIIYLFGKNKLGFMQICVQDPTEIAAGGAW